jgi:glucose-6-phosphate isomerase
LPSDTTYSRNFWTGAHQADTLAREKDIRKNAALMDAMIGVYLRKFCTTPSRRSSPIPRRLIRFPAHLQQLDMESNGKHVNRTGEKVGYPTDGDLRRTGDQRGSTRSTSWLHQGTDIIPLQFIGFHENQRGKDITIQGSTSQQKLNANLAAQIVAFARGKDDENPNKQFEGNRCSSLLSGKQLTPKALGALLSHFENKVMFQGFVWNLNSFDQEGVQLGKVLAKNVLSGCKGDPVLKAVSDLL